ncbi:hypothetical protein KCU65_g8915, partial [Aureobasidium melanogenum]
MAWTQDDLQSLEELLESRLRDQRTSPIEMNQEQEQRHPTEQEEQQPTQQEEPEQGRAPVQQAGLMNPQRDFIREVEPGTWKWIFTLLTYILAFSLIYCSPGQAPSIAEKPSAMIRDNHITIQVINPVNCTVSVPSTWPVASTPVASTSTATETVTATTTEKIRATVTEAHIPPSVTEYHIHAEFPGCMTTWVGNRLWSGCPEKGENVEDVIRRLMDESRG